MSLIFTLLLISGCSNNTINPEEQQLAELMALPYMTHTEGAANTSLAGVTVYDKERSYDGVNLYDGYLIDMEGNLLRNMSCPFLSIILDDNTYIGQKPLPEPNVCRTTMDDGMIWEKDILTHHEIIRSPDDTLMMFGKDVVDYNGRKVEFDTIMEFDMDGNFISEFSTWKNFSELHKYHGKLELDQPANYAVPTEHRMNESLWGGQYDYYHMNTLNFVPENSREGVHKAFTPGNWIVTMRHGSLVFILDKETKDVLWYWGWNDLQGPHASQMKKNGNLLIMDNGRYRNWSRVIEVDPVNLSIVWEYKADGFFTLTRGYIQQLPNGNLLITETDDGHAFELTPEKEIVWEYWNPHFNNESRREVIPRMVRYPKSVLS